MTRYEVEEGEKKQEHTQRQQGRVTVESYQLEQGCRSYWEHAHTRTIYGMNATMCVCAHAVNMCVPACLYMHPRGH